MRFGYLESTDQPMPTGKRNVQSANPPSEIEPNAPSIAAELHEPQEHTEREPRENQHQSGLQEDRLRLRELLDRVELEDPLGKRNGVKVNSTVGGDRRVRRVEDAPLGGPVKQVSDVAGAEASVVNHGVRWARHG